MSPINMKPYQHGGTVATRPIPISFTPVEQYRKRLRFQQAVRVKPIDCRMTNKERSRSHYTKNDFNTFALEARKAMSLSDEELSNESSNRGIVGLDADPSLRGLELYLCPDRARNRTLVRRALLKYHAKLSVDTTKTHEEKLCCLAAASARFGRSSRATAWETARLDSLRAYEGDYSIPIENPLDISRFPASAKRRRVSIVDDRPTKRRR